MGDLPFAESVAHCWAESAFGGLHSRSETR